MTWLIFAIFAYLFLALSAFFEKYLLKSSIKEPSVYAFYQGILGIFLFLIFIFEPVIPQGEIFFLALLSGGLLVFALFVYYQGVKNFELSRVVPILGPANTFTILFFNFLIFKETISYFDFVILGLFLVGMFFLTKEKGFSFPSLKSSLLAGFLFGVSDFLAKIVYLNLAFIPAFTLMRLGGVLISLFFLLSPKVRSAIFQEKMGLEIKTSKLFVLGSLFGGLGFVLQNLAAKFVSLKFLPLVYALTGLQYFFLLILIIVFSLKFPQILKEEMSKKILIRKFIGVLMISLGLFFLAFGGNF